ncbi:glycerate kinase [Bacillus sp. UNC41MFS5]|uniref:glycerate kinase n=1 Tax=Bacillus sp. UNC41MFS5 TaxID=1449046 RepID=UPI0004793E53|nr:glycerate kinase [Bacillus sp. UNC41MFS5]
MKVVIAPDSFKGSISAGDICFAIKEGILRVFPDAEIKAVPLADGGEGTLENMIYSSNGTLMRIKVKGPMGKEVIAAYGILGDGETVVVEMAQASGLPLVEPEERNPYIATSFGTGQLIKHALDAGYRRFIIGLGGSATNDCGTGMLTALGLKLFDKNGNILTEGGGFLSDLSFFDESGLDPRIVESNFTIASDVINKLCGKEGASVVFGPQKGASPEMVKHLDDALSHFADIVYKQKGVDIKRYPGGGAAGGMGAALIAFLGASVQSGVDVIMKEVDFDGQIIGADLIITGEGKLDAQTISGKVISGVSKIARKHQVPVIVICGGVEIEPTKFNELGILSAFSIVPGPCSLNESMKKSAAWITERTEAIIRIISYYK